MAAAHSGNSSTVNAPPATSREAVASSSSPLPVAIVVTATIMGRPAAEYRASSIFSLVERSSEPVSVKRSATNTGSPRASKIPATTSSSTSGKRATTDGSIAMPLTTKKSGIRNENPTVSRRRVIKCNAPTGVSERKIMPAAKAPSTASSPKSAANMMRVASRNMARRRIVWLVVFASAAIICRSPGTFSNRRCGTMAVTTATAINPSRIRIASPGECEDNSSDIAKIGKSSPTAPCTSTALPTRVPAAPCDLSIGSSVPKAVELSAIPTAI